MQAHIIIRQALAEDRILCNISWKMVNIPWWLNPLDCNQSRVDQAQRPWTSRQLVIVRNCRKMRWRRGQNQYMRQKAGLEGCCPPAKKLRKKDIKKRKKEKVKLQCSVPLCVPQSSSLQLRCIQLYWEVTSYLSKKEGAKSDHDIASEQKKHPSPGVNDSSGAKPVQGKVIKVERSSLVSGFFKESVGRLPPEGRNGLTKRKRRSPNDHCPEKFTYHIRELIDLTAYPTQCSAGNTRYRYKSRFMRTEHKCPRSKKELKITLKFPPLRMAKSRAQGKKVPG